MKFFWAALYFFLLGLFHILALYGRLYLPGMIGAAPTGVFLLISIPFALLAIIWPGLRPRYFIYFFGINLVVQSLVYFSLSYLAPEVFALYFKRYGLKPLLQSQGVLLALSIMIGLGLQMKARHKQPILRRRGNDKEELENLYELKRQQIPEEGLTYFRYRQLLATGIGLVASKGIEIMAAIQLVTRARTFYLYDLVGGEQKESQAHGILFLFEKLLRRPEIALNKPDNIIYLFRKSDKRLRLLLEEYRFERVELSDPRSKEWSENLKSVLKTEFEGWSPFADLECYYVLEMQQ